MLRLAAKYDVAYLRLQAAKRLRQWYPDHLRDFILRRKQSSDAFYPTNIIAALDLARTAQVPSCIPAILTDICCLSPTDFLAREGLNVEDQVLIVTAISRFHKLMRALPLRWLYQHVDACSTPLECPSKRATTILSLELSALAHDPIYFGDFRAVLASAGLCQICHDAGDRAYTMGRQMLWEMLPEVFDIPSWDVLRQQSGIDVCESLFWRSRRFCWLSRCLWHFAEMGDGAIVCRDAMWLCR